MILQSALRTLKRGSYLTLAVGMLGAWVAADVWLLQKNAAAEQMLNRRLTLSSSANGSINMGAKGSGPNGAFATHKFEFTPTTAGSIGSIKFEYCTTPLPGTACVAPTGLDVSTVTSVGGAEGTGGGWALGTVTASEIQVTRTAAPLATTMREFIFGMGSTGTDYIKNPTTDNTTFFVRITTYSDAAYTTAVDNGTVANSTAQQIDITAKVQEVLGFSAGTVYVAPFTAPATAGCDPFNDVADTYALALGDADGVLSFNQAYDKHSFYRVSTNANNGTAVLYSADTLKAGSNSIAAIGATAATSVPGSAQFGLAGDSSDPNWALTSLVETGNYDGGEGTITVGGTAEFAFDTASLTSPVEIATAAGTITCDTGVVRYLGNISTTTPPGIYKTSITYLVTPTY